MATAATHTKCVFADKREASAGRVWTLCFARCMMATARKYDCDVTAMSSEPVGKPNNVHLLVVEDDEDIVDLIRRYFSTHGFDVSAAHDGPSMRAILDARGADVVLLDLGLPGEDGFTLTRQLRERWKGALIIVTGRGDAVDRVVGLELGADEFVTKPFALRELL